MATFDYEPRQPNPYRRSRRIIAAGLCVTGPLLLVGGLLALAIQGKPAKIQGRIVLTIGGILVIDGVFLRKRRRPRRTLYYVALFLAATVLSEFIASLIVKNPFSIGPVSLDRADELVHIMKRHYWTSFAVFVPTLFALNALATTWLRRGRRRLQNSSVTA